MLHDCHINIQTDIHASNQQFKAREGGRSYSRPTFNMVKNCIVV